MRIGLCSPDADVPQHLLNHPYVRSVVKQMRGKRMSNELRIHLDAGLETDSHNHIPHGCGSQRLPANEHCWGDVWYSSF